VVGRGRVRRRPPARDASVMALDVPRHRRRRDGVGAVGTLRWSGRQLRRRKLALQLPQSQSGVDKRLPAAAEAV